MKNAMIPVVTVVGLQLGNLLGSAIVTETIFALPGVGRLVVDSIYQRDFPLVQGVTLYLAVIFLVVNLVVDMIYAYLDPRIRYS
jgi:peptide/nickel transport system permease protein